MNRRDIAGSLRRQSTQSVWCRQMTPGTKFGDQEHDENAGEVKLIGTREFEEKKHSSLTLDGPFSVQK
jgi:hypothetical protein